MLHLAAALALLATVSAASASVPQRKLADRMADACGASATDLVGQRLARECRSALRARYARQQRGVRS